jgi:hypothetical protein
MADFNYPSLSVTASSGPVQFDLNGSNTTVSEDTTTPANSNPLPVKVLNQIVTEVYDYLAITYIGATDDIDTVTYKTGGAGGTTVAVLTMAYDGSGRLDEVTRS